jgi:hypothetical protein
MDPLFDVQEAFGDARVNAALRERVVEEGWLQQDAEPDQIYHGTLVDWVGRPGHMLRVQWDQVQPTPLNPFDPGKVATFASLMRDPSESVVAAAPAGMVSIVGLVDVEETQKAAKDDELFESHGMTRPFTTGDDELDEYLADPEQYLEYYAADDDDADVIQAEMSERAEAAVIDSDGDIGNLVVYLRDGNHRAMAAQLAGESDLWVDVRWHSPAELEYVGLRRQDFD